MFNCICMYGDDFSKAEFVIYKLKEMGKVTDKDILQVCTIYDRLDTANFGKISISDLLRSQER